MTRLFIFIFGLSRFWKMGIIFFTDFFILLFSLYFSIALRMDNFHSYEIIINSKFFILSSIILIPLFLFISKTIYIIIRSFSSNDLISLMTYSILLGSSYGFINFLTNSFIPRSIPIIFIILFFILILISRYFFYRVSYALNQKNSYSKKVVIFGAGLFGKQLFASFSQINSYNIVGFIDDNINLQNMMMFNQKIYSRKNFQKKFLGKKINEAWISTSSLEPEKLKSIFDYLNKIAEKVLILPQLNEILYSSNIQKNLIEVSPESFINRNKVDIDLSSYEESYVNKNILITGAGGSIGSELCKQIIKLKPKKLVLFENSEYALYKVKSELDKSNIEEDTQLISILGTVLDQKKIENIIDDHRINCLIHAAAFKHVNLVEENIYEGLFNNTIGTYTLLQAIKNKTIQNFIFISTDKAVRPSSAMGASKRLAEILIQTESTKNKETKFSIVRFGNVLGSSGSVVPIFKQQILHGGPVTITDKNMVRYFMSISEAAQLILVSGSLDSQGDIFLLDMGEPVKIIDLVKKMISISGLTEKTSDNPDGDIEIKVINKRPGEKIVEELLFDGKLKKTSHEKIFIANETKLLLSDTSIVYNFINDHPDTLTTQILLSFLKKLQLEIVTNE